MARIRTIKPEFPHSESMGRVSRDARLLFIMLWTICDDSGRTRGNSRMLASLLFPYDDDANKHISSWLKQLEDECCLVRYQVDGQSYIEICNWLNHQKIDKPTPSKLPAPDADSRGFERIREPVEKISLGVDQGVDQGKELIAPEKPARKKSYQLPKDFTPNDACISLADKLGIEWEPELPKFIDHHSHKQSLGSDWNAAFRTWLHNSLKWGTSTRKVVGGNSNTSPALC